MAVFKGQVFGQSVQDLEGRMDSAFLSQDCKLSEEQVRKIFTKLEVLADFQGGFQSWINYANNNFDFDYLTSNGTSRTFQDSVVLKFVVTRIGTICAIKVINGNPFLEKPAIKLLKYSPDWRPGSNGSRLVNSYRTVRLDIYIDKQRNLRQIKPSSDSYFRENNLD